MLDAKIFLKAIDELEEKGISRDEQFKLWKNHLNQFSKRKTMKILE